ncbi:hypothetical protein K438DRAFT_1223547 [Mycena galopus ATCC 62051]|nr:hypothetical protein K438DRAFT_1223547 [Mycena galopus ATCC 62051]
MYQHRLEAAGWLWIQSPAELKTVLKLSANSADSADHQEQIAQSFQREKVLQTARDCLDIYARLLGENQFVYHDRLTTLDIVLAAHVLVLTKPPFPDRLLTDLLTESYPTLVAHAERIQARSLQLSAPIQAPPAGYSIRSLIPSLAPSQQQEKSEGETHFERAAWGWSALAVGSVGLLLVSNRR